VPSVRVVLPLVAGMLLAGQGIAGASTPVTVGGVWTHDTRPSNNTAFVSGEAIRFAAEGGPSDGGGDSPGDGGNSAGDGGNPAGDGVNSPGDGGNSAGDGGNPADGAAKPKHASTKSNGNAKPKGGGAKSKSNAKPKGDGGESTDASGDPVASNNADPPPVSARVPTVQSLTPTVAASRTKSVLSRRFGRAYTRGNHKRVSCRPQGSGSYVCSLSWRYHRQRYNGRAIVSPGGPVRTHVVSRQA
jgi:hypothetical protein